MDKWTELRTVYKLAKLGTLSATAADLGVHRSTVMRHVDALENQLGVVLFQRSDKGYLATEAGLEIMRLGEVTDQQFSHLSAQLKNQAQALAGTLTLTMVNEMAGLVMPSIQQYQSQHPNMRVNILGDLRNFDLQYGEADLAIRAGPKPQTPDNVVMPLLSSDIIFCAHQNYIQHHGQPTQQSIQEHRFLALNERPLHLPWNEWIYDNLEESNIALTSSSAHILNQALFTGLGIGVLPSSTVARHPDLMPVELDQSWRFHTWILVHRDMFNMAKIQTFLSILKQQFADNTKQELDLFQF